MIAHLIINQMRSLAAKKLINFFGLPEILTPAENQSSLIFPNGVKKSKA